MIYKQQTEKKEGARLVRTYLNSQTGTEVKTSLIYTDKDGGKWWGFMDLYKIPMIRMAMAKNITDLFTIGLSLRDILDWCNQEKALLNSNDPEKFQKLYSLILEKEKVATLTADPIRQSLALCTVYVLTDEERIDYFDDNAAEQKLQLWKGIPEMVAFFLSWQNSHIQRYLKNLDKISETVLKLEKASRRQQ